MSRTCVTSRETEALWGHEHVLAAGPPLKLFIQGAMPRVILCVCGASWMERKDVESCILFFSPFCSNHATYNVAMSKVPWRIFDLKEDFFQ